MTTTNWNYYGNLDLARDLIAAGFVEEQFNSNNPWGFGGAEGRRFTRDNVAVKIARAYLRHLKPADFVSVTIDGRRVLDEPQSDRTAFARARDLALSV